MGQAAFSLLKVKINFSFISTLVFSGLFASSALATPRTLPFSYPYETLSKGELELEAYTDVNPLRVAADPADSTAGLLWSPEYRLQTEFEYGLSDRVELGFYQVFEALHFRIRHARHEPIVGT